jgi:hypothetical protein
MNHIEFYSSSRSGMRAQATGAVDEIRRRGSHALSIGLDSLRVLDDSALAAIIVVLCGMRDVGGSVSLVTDSSEHLERLTAAGLDRVLDVFSSKEAAIRHSATLRYRPSWLSSLTAFLANACRCGATRPQSTAGMFRAITS